MVKPQVIEEQPITLAELKEELKKIRKKEKDLNFRAGRTEEYLNQFVSISKAEADVIIAAIQKLKISRLKDAIVFKIVDALPKTVDELKIILQAYTITIPNESMKKIVDIINKKTEE